MRNSLLVAALGLVMPVSAARQAPAAPCITATTSCEHWVTIKGGPGRGMVYSSFSLDAPNPAVTRALILIHGVGRNADHYFETATAAAFLAGALENTVVIAPHLIAANDTPQANEVKWPNSGNSWRAGGISTTHPGVSAFDFADDIIRLVANKRNFPNLTQVVIAGHSAGGQFVGRYEMSNKIDPLPGVKISYVVANPSSYSWPAAVRPLATGDADRAKAAVEALGPNGMKVNSDFTYGIPDVARVPTYNDWPFGLAKRSGYTADMSDTQLKKNLATRTTTYLFGQVDILPLANFDSSAVAMTQGPTRRARGEAFVKFISDSLGAKPKAMIVSECGHNDRCIFTTKDVLPVIFPQ
jgi:pimeloyl-ACP methyl ester carboxylesterase